VTYLDTHDTDQVTSARDLKLSSTRRIHSRLCTACYQLRAKKMELSRESTLSISRLMAAKRRLCSRSYDLC
jgi:hypothetical protein